MPTAPDSALQISPAWLAALAAGIGGMFLGYPVACILFQGELEHRVPEAFVALTTGLLCVLVVLRAAGRESRMGAGFSALGWSLVAGGVNAGLAAQCQSLHPIGQATLAPFVLGTAFGLVLASPLAAGFALVNAALALLARDTRRASSHQAVDLMVGYVGAIVAAFGALRLAWVPDGWALVPIVLGSAVGVIGFGRARARSAWVRAVDLGEVPGLSLEVLEGDTDPSLPCLIGKREAATAVIVQQPAEGQHYRHIPRERHVAVIDLWGA